jgi:cytoskeleton protein RodZ
MSADRTPIDFGSKLRDARERRGVSLRDIANSTKISFAALEALERNDISRLPGGIFSRAFVRSYAVEVGLDPESTIQEFIDAFPHDSVTVGHPTSDQVEDIEATESHRRIARTVARLLAVSLPIAALVLYFGIAGRRTGVFNESPQGAMPASSPPGPPATPVATSEPPAASPERVPPSTTDPGSRSAPAAVTPLASPAAAPAPSSEAADLLTIGLSVRTPCVVSAIVDGRKAIDQVLRPGDQRTIAVRREMVLTVGDASAVVMTLNGAGARPLGTPGEVVTVRLNLSNFKDYLPPRGLLQPPFWISSNAA